MAATVGEWECEAYGDGAMAVGAWCFRSPAVGQRVCGDREACATFMHGERRRVFQRMQELAAQGEPTAVELVGLFTSPDQLLGGPDQPTEP